MDIIVKEKRIAL